MNQFTKPAKAAGWAPKPGDLCWVVGPRIKHTDGGSAIYLPVNEAALVRLVQFAEAQDSTGVHELLAAGRVIRFEGIQVAGKVINPNRTAGLVEVRLTDREAMNQLVIVPAAQLLERKY